MSVGKRTQVKVILGIHTRRHIDVKLQHLEELPLQFIPKGERKEKGTITTKKTATYHSAGAKQRISRKSRLNSFLDGWERETQWNHKKYSKSTTVQVQSKVQQCKQAGWLDKECMQEDVMSVQENILCTRGTENRKSHGVFPGMRFAHTVSTIALMNETISMVIFWKKAIMASSVNFS